MSGDAISRGQLVQRFNVSFASENLAATQTQLGAWDDQWDFLDVMYRLGHLFFLRDGQFATYRQRLGIPMLHQRMLTEVFRTSLTSTPPHPIVFHVISGPLEALSVTTVDDTLHVLLTRTSYENLAPATA